MPSGQIQSSLSGALLHRFAHKTYWKTSTNSTLFPIALSVTSMSFLVKSLVDPSRNLDRTTGIVVGRSGLGAALQCQHDNMPTCVRYHSESSHDLTLPWRPADTRTHLFSHPHESIISAHNDCWPGTDSLHGSVPLKTSAPLSHILSPYKETSDLILSIHYITSVAKIQQLQKRTKGIMSETLNMTCLIEMSLKWATENTTLRWKKKFFLPAVSLPASSFRFLLCH